ncbi:methyl-accepting chemotaxis protein [Actinotalea sp. M2MS4P-6]|uniref:methyl-accepting chemotaxis protein n=1 Tax=Actinotalea sp. M2MS4P-6 TaxID=2983762 RepID=UPI0021E48754|nr:methyl-accepting chemotaxis protein [Actinotalea sp. M2MS4P-6]MCV2392817.1 methyl-accepting chemotaxis protein [Actinotalea sp. M2MS4P-6]
MSGLRVRLVVSHMCCATFLICAAIVAAERVVAVIAGIGAVVAALSAWTLVRQVAAPTRELGRLLDAGAAGDLSQRGSSTRRDELGDLVRRYDAMADVLGHRIAETTVEAGGIGAAAEELTVCTGEIREGAMRTAEHSGVVAAAAEQVSGNLRTVAAATEQMGASIREIAQSTGTAARFASTAVGTVRTTSSTVERLGSSSVEIGDVVKVITSIAEQTNLLALNATIEAARAGEAGKGFAVVAGEVKDLARETAAATDDIGRRIEALQADSGAATAAIAEISAMIEEINATQATIASAIEEQTAATSEMSRNISEAAQGADNIAESVTAIASGATAASEGVSQAFGLSDELSKMSGALAQSTAAFTLSADAAAATETVHGQITKAIGAHGAWKHKLAEAVARRSHDMDVATVAKSDACAFGRWLRDVRPTEADSATHQRAASLHAQFHREAAGVLTMITKGEIDRARTTVEPGGTFAESSRVLTRTMIEWRRATAGTTTARC